MLESKWTLYMDNFRECAWTVFSSLFFKHFTLIGSVLFTWSGKSLGLKNQSSQFYPHRSESSAAFHHPLLGDSEQGLTKQHKSGQWSNDCGLLDLWFSRGQNITWITREPLPRKPVEGPRVSGGSGGRRDSNNPFDNRMPLLRITIPVWLLSQHLLCSALKLQLCLLGMSLFKTFP